jgi:hypothetical protein
MFAVIAREGHELVEDLDLVSNRCVSIPHSQGRLKNEVQTPRIA